MLMIPAASEPVVENLTPREMETLEMLAEGLSNKQIAARLYISEHTAKFHVNSILGKLGAGTRTEAVMRGFRSGLLKVREEKSPMSNIIGSLPIPAKSFCKGSFR